jgi:hypothetical protein
LLAQAVDGQLRYELALRAAELAAQLKRTTRCSAGTTPARRFAAPSFGGTGEDDRIFAQRRSGGDL